MHNSAEIKNMGSEPRLLGSNPYSIILSGKNALGFKLQKSIPVVV